MRYARRHNEECLLTPASYSHCSNKSIFDRRLSFLPIHLLPKIATIVSLMKVAAQSLFSSNAVSLLYLFRQKASDNVQIRFVEFCTVQRKVNR